MVRAGVVAHPSAWKVPGYHEIQSPAERYRILDREALADLLPLLKSIGVLAARHAGWIESALHEDQCVRDGRWSRAIAVGSEVFVQGVRAQLGIRAVERSVRIDDGIAHLAEEPAPYDAVTRQK